MSLKKQDILGHAQALSLCNELFFVKIAKNIHEVLLMMVEFQNCLKSIYLLNVMLENDKLF